MNSGHMFLPLLRWVEAQGSLAPDRAITHPWRWIMNLMLAGMSWVWTIFRWMAELAAETAGQSELADTLPGRLGGAAGALIPFALAATAGLLVWRVAISKSKTSPREALQKAGLSAVFVAAAASTAFLSIPARAIDTVDETAGAVTLPALDYANSQLLSLTETDASGTPAGDDPLGCGAYLDELHRRADGSHPLLLTLDTWMRWSVTPYWRAANYGLGAGGTAERMHCRALETASGAPPSELAGITVCAYANAANPAAAPVGSDSPASDTAGTVPGCEETGRAALLLGLGNPGPFRRATLMTEQDHIRQETAWVMCHGPDPGNPENTWQLNPAVSEYEITLPERAGGTETVTLGAVNGEHNFCYQWFTGDRPSDLHVCAPWTDQKGFCYRPLNSLTSDHEPATLVEPTGRVFDFRPANLANWNTHPANTAVAAGDIPKGWEETRSWAVVRNRGGGGAAELSALAAGFVASLAFAPVIAGLAGGVAMSQLLTTLMLAAAPFFLLAGAHTRTRKDVLWPAFKLLVLFAAAELLLTWLMIVYTVMFWALGSVSPFDFGTFPGLLWAAATPIAATFLLVRLFRSETVRALAGGLDLGSPRDVLSAGSGGGSQTGGGFQQAARNATRLPRSAARRAAGTAQRHTRRATASLRAGSRTSQRKHGPAPRPGPGPGAER